MHYWLLRISFELDESIVGEMYSYSERFLLLILRRIHNGCSRTKKCNEGLKKKIIVLKTKRNELFIKGEKIIS